MQIAFIGLGNMGGGMAANQAKAGRIVRAFDVSKDALDRAAAAGCVAAASAADAVKGANAVVTMLPSGAHVRAVYEADVLPNAEQGAMLIDCSTIDVETARAVAADAIKRAMRPADAPVSGGMSAANTGSLAFMVGCAEKDFTEIESVLAPMSRATIRAGDYGAGQAAKICNNMLLAISMIGVSEAFALAEKLNLDAGRFFEIASKSSGQCWSLTSYCPWPGVIEGTPASNGYKPGFATALMLKDLRLARDAARSTGAVSPLGEHAEELYANWVEAGQAHSDFSSIVELFRRGH
ncbi:MAG: 3-hydroxyisobutyrate dehydrogenase [Hyphomonadaceae bacterium]|nr:3-hydroxyisobutyrate dehydrogenase [Hyphomonadaceae bacterium]